MYIEKSSMALSQATLPARSLGKAGRLSFGYVTQLTVEQGFTQRGRGQGGVIQQSLIPGGCAWGWGGGDLPKKFFGSSSLGLV